MLEYLKENGFPCAISFESEKVSDKETGWAGYESTIYDENDNIIKKITHKELQHRALWADGYFTSIETKNKENE